MAMKQYKTLLIVVILFFNLILVMVPTVSATNYVYMTMEDGIIPTFSSQKSANHSLDDNHTIDNRYCLNLTYTYAESIQSGPAFPVVLNEGYTFDNPFRSDVWEVKFRFSEFTNDTHTYFELGPNGFPFVTVDFVHANTSVKITGDADHWVTIGFQYDTNYRLQFNNIDYTDETFDVNLSNSTNYETVTDIGFTAVPGGTTYRIVEFVIKGDEASNTRVFLDDWTIGTSVETTTNAATNVEEEDATLSGELTNDGSPFQNSSQTDVDVTFYYGFNSTPILPYYLNQDTTSGYSAHGDLLTNQFIGQSFTINSTSLSNITSVALPLYVNNTYNGTISGTVTMQIRSINDALYINNDTDVVNMTINLANLTENTDSNWMNFTFDTPFNLSMGSYAVILNKTVNSVCTVFWRENNQDVYSGGRAMSSMNLTNWTAHDTGPTYWNARDFGLRIYGNHDYNNTVTVTGDQYTGDTFTTVLDDLVRGRVYYYRVYANTSYGNSTSTSWGDEQSFLMKPEAPTSVSVTYPNSTAVRFNWTQGIGANNTVILMKNTGYPTSVTDGTVMYNGTDESWNATSLQNGVYYYYSMWSYNEWETTQRFHSHYSDNQTNVTYGMLYVNCYDEDTNESLTFDIFISNQSGTATYESVSNTNTLSISMADLPIGDNGIIQICSSEDYENKTEHFTGYTPDQNETTTYVIVQESPRDKASTNVTVETVAGGVEYPPFTLDGDVITILPNDVSSFHAIWVNYTHQEYECRVYYLDIQLNYLYTLNSWLPPIDTTEVSLYLISVVDDNDDPVDDATVVFKRSIDGVFQNISILQTSDSGQVNVYLIPDVLHKVEISKSGYVTTYEDYIPSSDILTHSFTLVLDDVDITPDHVESEEIDFSGYISGTILYINYTDNLDSTVDTQIYIYEINSTTGAISLFTSFTDTTNSDYQVNTTINNSNSYQVILYYNHSIFGNIRHTLYFQSTITTLTTGSEANNLFNLNYGGTPFGWSNIFMFIFLTACLFSFGQRGAGISLILTGSMFLFINSIIGFGNHLSTVAGGVIPVLFVIVGVLVIWKNSRKEGISG